ncbi:MAG: CehA/McbA family metallohydrolase [Armatimonadetes bacterium]|nr:CehA/McbA family metallohydrolase [Armatimonadota bacterium]
MNEYEPLDLSAYANADGTILPHPNAPCGAVQVRGLPFLIGSETPGGQSLIVLEGGQQAVRLPVGRPCRRLLVLHVLLETQVMEGGPVGLPVATYRFCLAGGEVVEQTIRERFEIAVARPPWGQQPFCCHADHPDSKPDREAGPWGSAGLRLTEAAQAGARYFYLWSWQVPAGALLESLEIQPRGPRFAVAAVTLGQLDEEPVPREAAVPVVIELTDDLPRAGHLDLDVDRGTATYVQALPAAAADPAAPLAGWGEPQNTAAAPAVAHVAAIDSATLSVRHGTDALGRVRWGELRQEGVAVDGAVRVRLADTGRNWVHTRVVDDQTGETLPCRVHFRSPEGIPFAPHGHHAYAAGNLASWHLDVGGDLRLGQLTYAYIDGTCQGWLPRGEVVVDVARGYEYQPLRTTVRIERGQRELELRLRRVRDMNVERYFSGDSHVHFLSTVGAHTEAAGEGLNVVNLLQSQWGHLFTNTEEFTGEASVRAGQRTIVYAAQENRQHILGHLTLLNQKRPIMPWCSGGPSESFLGDNLETTLSRWADACHEQGGTVVLPHIPNPNGEPAALIATGRVDAVEFLRHDAYYRQEYYRYLNAGYRLPLVGGTDKMTQDVPVGLYRTYVHIPADEEFTYDNWCRHLRGGNTFLSGGPLLTLRVDGHPPGDTVKLSGNGGTVSVEVVATSVFPMYDLELVRQGRVVARADEPAGAHRLELRAELKIDAPTWLAARTGELDGAPRCHHDGWQRGVMAHTSPVYVAVGQQGELFDAAVAQYMLTLIDGSLEYIRHTARQFPHDHERVTHAHHHHDHVAWLEEPFHEAAAAIHRRMHQFGIPH